MYMLQEIRVKEISSYSWNIQDCVQFLAILKKIREISKFSGITRNS